MAETKYAYSLDQENYIGGYDNENDAIRDGTDAAYDYWDNDGPMQIHIGEVKPAQDYLPPMRQWIGEQIAETVDEWLGGEIFSDDPLLELNSEQCVELGELVMEWLTKHATFNHDGITNIRELTV